MKNKFYISILLFFCLSGNLLNAKYEEDYIEEEENFIPVNSRLLNEKTTRSHQGHIHYTYDQFEFWISALISAFLCSMAALCSGLSVGYLSIDELTLQIMLKTGSEDEKRAAVKIMPIIQKHHVLISTLLIGNALALESLPIFIESILPASVAIVFSTVLVVIFGEILPQAYCTGPDKLKIAENMSCLINFMILLFSCLAYPMGAYLDWLLGVHGATRFPRKDLKALIQIHQVNKKDKKSNVGDVPDSEKGEIHEHKPHAGLRSEEVEMITGTIDLRDKKVTDAMIDIKKVFMIDSREKFTQELFQKITSKGYSRIPIVDHMNKCNIIGFLKTKNLIENREHYINKLVTECSVLQKPLIVAKDTNLLEMLMIFQDKKGTLAMINEEVRKKKSVIQRNEEIFFSRRNLVVENQLNDHNFVGLISLKDIFESILNKELHDGDIHKSYNPGPISNSYKRI